MESARIKIFKLEVSRNIVTMNCYLMFSSSLSHSIVSMLYNKYLIAKAYPNFERSLNLQWRVLEEGKV